MRILFFISFFLLSFVEISLSDRLFAQSSSTEDAKIITNSISNENAQEVSEFLPQKNVENNQEILKSIETDFYFLKISSRGAEIVDFLHKDSINKRSRKMDIRDDKELVFQVYNNAISYHHLRNLYYTFSVNETSDQIEVIANADTHLLTSLSEKLSIKLQKRFVFHKKLHYFEFHWKIINISSKPLFFPYIIFLPDILEKDIGEIEKDKQDARHSFPFYSKNGDFEKLGTGFLGISANDDDLVISGSIDFIGRTSRFFAMTLQPLQDVEKLHYYGKSKETHLQMKSIQLSSGKEHEISFLSYVGPKVKDYLDIPITYESSLLSQKDPALYKSFDFGITAPVRDLLIWCLQALYVLIPNYGIGILLLSILLKLLFFPLNQKQLTSMKKMQDLQPEIQKINNKYKDLQERQKKTMNLYKQYGVNPLGGCLPVLIQLPVFIALYSAFSDSYVLWQAPFIEPWIKDLSSPDTVYTFQSLPLFGSLNLNILPIFMVVTQFFQSKMTSISSDPNQKKIMQFLPVIFLFFFWNMPSGVVLYWTSQNILSIGQSLMVKKMMKK